MDSITAFDSDPTSLLEQCIKNVQRKDAVPLKHNRRNSIIVTALFSRRYSAVVSAVGLSEITWPAASSIADCISGETGWLTGFMRCIVTRPFCQLLFLFFAVDLQQPFSSSK